MSGLFTRCGGRQRLIKMEKFLHFFASEAGPFETHLPVPTLLKKTLCLATHYFYRHPKTYSFAGAGASRTHRHIKTHICCGAGEAFPRRRDSADRGFLADPQRRLSARRDNREGLGGTEVHCRPVQVRPNTHAHARTLNTHTHTHTHTRTHAHTHTRSLSLSLSLSLSCQIRPAECLRIVRVR